MSILLANGKQWYQRRVREGDAGQMTQKQIVISRFCLGGRSFYFHTHWNVEDFSVTITDGKYAWHGQADSEYIEETLKPKGMEMEEYLLLTKEALTTQDLEKKKFSYGLQQGSNSSEIKLVWNIRLNTDSTLPEDFFMKVSSRIIHQGKVKRNRLRKNCFIF
eukprot:TRINITY_DN1799_c0_g1_i16.p1 TRINITY_DN1799_c0_g1~~TRINITY_DN1799_c0_g1_i16.p1  ORF type:complete len:162 (+),score=37.38 TRINITY_DN1799_c0_g1_i16:1-486(+)